MKATIMSMTLLISAVGYLFGNDYPIRPLPFTAVEVQDTFWRGRMETVIKETIPHAFRQSEETGRIRNFMAAGSLISAKFEGDFGFNDSDVYKIIEGASYALSLRYDAELDAYLDRLISYIAAAQEDDGYLYTAWTLKARESNPNIYCCYIEKRWDNLRSSHELYNVGHLYEAAAAHFQATGKRTLLDVALKNADFLCETFGPDKLQDYPGHQEVEIGLVKLYRITGKEKYLNLARFFLDIRGRGIRKYPEYGRNWELATYTQDHKPVVEQEEAIGHAVRATYMYSAMADVAALSGDQAYLNAIDRIWRSVVNGKLYVTGGIGDIPEGEAFGPAYHLPNRTAYCETCASIANVFWNHRMFLLHGNAEYLDVLERTLYNALLSGLSLDGKTFFYPNVLETTGDERSPWFGCACCPSNLCRFIPSLPGYIFAEKGEDVYVNLFISSRTTVNPKGIPIELNLKTDYPWDGKIELIVNPKKAGRFTLHVRIPGWATGRPVPSDLYQFLEPSDEKPQLLLNGAPVSFQEEKGFAVISRVWKRGDRLELTLPMPVRR
ncbi:MAG: glycoside hydrolase family 127 protein, partial [candidate division KSB1 bacterium]|nr:glycoside hydrolase family 127 protein [candidate division KSB1 bacterium]